MSSGIRLTLSEMQEIALNRDGKCLSSTYINKNKKLKWKCSKGHTWEATPNSVKYNKSWCPQCSKYHKKISKNDLEKIAFYRNGKFLSKKFLGMKTNHKWQCQNGHIWLATPSNIKNHKSWCPHCSGRVKTIKDMKLLGESRNGICLSDEYKNASSKLKWKCKEGHIFYMSPNSVQQGQWCSKCIKFGHFSEEICRTTFEQLFNDTFPKVRPKWLKSTKGYSMELDGYNERLQLAFEYQGEQHFLVGRYTKNTIQLNHRIKNDKLKLELCKENGVTLIVINFKQNLLELSDFIKVQCYENKYNVNSIDFKNIIDLNQIYFHKSILFYLNELAIKKGGELLSKKYIGNKSKLKWKCKEGHVWDAISISVKRGTWCPTCAKRPKLNISDMNEFALDNNGICLSKTYTNAKTKLKWKCSNGHVWHTTYDNMKRRKNWCVECN